MITAIDTSVLLDVLLPNEKFYDRSAEAIEHAASSGSLVICDIVYAELCIHFTAQRECDDFLESNDIRVEPLHRDTHFIAGRVWRVYRSQGGKRTRILADFFIGAHAQSQATQLLSRDRGFYRRLFPALRLIDAAAKIDT